MDDDDHPNDGGLHHILDTQQVGQVPTNASQGILPQNPHNEELAPQQPLSDAHALSSMPPSEPRSEAPHLDSPPRADTVTRTASSSPSYSGSTPHTTSPAASSTAISYPCDATHGPSNDDGPLNDVVMMSASESGSSAPVRPPLEMPYRSARRARVEEDEDEEHGRQFNRQRMYSPTDHDGEHHFMPGLEDIIPQSTPLDGASSQRRAVPQSGQAPRSPAPPTQYSRMMWSFDFIPTPNPNVSAPGTAQEPEADQPDGHQNEQQQQSDGQPILNFFINFPIPGQSAPPVGEATNHPHVGGNAPGHPGFAFPPFPFPFGMDILEERDDPNRAKRLVHGLEEVPCGLVKRMERAGGPGTARGQVPTCSICWENLLDPEGGGFAGNAELAQAEAAEAARDVAASQRESSTDTDGPAPTSSSSSTNEPSGASTSTPEPGESNNPKIVVLPCSHAFHATCLLPWFSKPGRTTCPSCRFDIDPDSLTYEPRPLHTRPRPQPAPQGNAAPQPQPQPQSQPVFLPLPPLTAAAQAQTAPIPPTAAQANAIVPVSIAPSLDANSQTQPAQNATQRQQPLPPFVTFDISMIVPVFPGRAPGAAPPGHGANPTLANPDGALPSPPPRTDSNGFRLDDTLLQEAVRTTFERIFGRSLPPLVPQHPPVSGAGENVAPPDQQLFTFAGPITDFPSLPPLNINEPLPDAPRHRPGPRRPVEKRRWAPPPAPGPTLRQIVERNEREMGLRCSDISCGLGPSDDDPMSSIDFASHRRISIRPLKTDQSGTETVCEHKFHSACLISAERVAGWGREVKTGEPADADEDVEVSCPVCRHKGAISRSEWEEGVCELA